jgi:hypothetical protein
VIRTVLAAATALSMAVTPVSHALAACYTAPEATAVHVRMLQSELMVAALACRDSNPELGMIGEYNSFMRKFGDRLVSHSQELQGHFRKNYGQQARPKMDSFITGLANNASKRSMTSSGYCQEASTLFRNISVLERRDLERLAATRAVESGERILSCAADGGTSRAAQR